MGSTITKIEITQLPEHTSHARELQWQLDFFQNEYNQAKAQRETAWKMYQAAVDNEAARDEINELYAFACMFDDMASEAWNDLDYIKANYLQLFN